MYMWFGEKGFIMNEDLILLEKLQDILDDLDFIVESDIETSARLKLMEVI